MTAIFGVVEATSFGMLGWYLIQATLLIAALVDLRRRRQEEIRRGNGGNTEERVTGMRGQNPNRAMKLSRAALAFRIFHAAIAAEQLLAIGYVWWCALTGRRGRLLRLATASLIAEGMLVSANHGDCPLGGLQRRLGDPVPLFELVLSPRAAKRAVPMLGAITAAGLALLLVRGRREDR